MAKPPPAFTAHCRLVFALSATRNRALSSARVPEPHRLLQDVLAASGIRDGELVVLAIATGHGRNACAARCAGQSGHVEPATMLLCVLRDSY